MKSALACGYRHIDCAHVYENEPAVGAGLKDCISQGIVKREDVFITSKVSQERSSFCSRTFVQYTLVHTLYILSSKRVSFSICNNYLFAAMAYEVTT